MKSLIIASLLFFSLRAMSEESATVGEVKKSPCPFANQDARKAKAQIVDAGTSDAQEKKVEVISK